MVADEMRAEIRTRMETNLPRPGEHEYRGLAGLIIASLAFFVPLTAWVTSGDALSFDQDFHQRLAQLGNDTVTRVAWLAVNLASAGVIVAVLTVLWLIAVRQRCRAVAVAASEIGALALNLALKYLFHRTRPGESAPAYLFPSTHMVLTVVTYGTLAGLIVMHVRGLRRWLITGVTVCLVACVGLSLVYLDQHYLTDVIGGLLIGGTWLGVSLTLLSHVAPGSR